MLDKSLIKWRQRPDMAIAVDWDVKHQLKKFICTPLAFFRIRLFAVKLYFLVSIPTYCPAVKGTFISLKTGFFGYAKTKAQISCAVTAQVISAFVFATRIIQFIFYLNPKFQASIHLLWLYRPVCVGPCRKSRRPVSSLRGCIVNLYLPGTHVQCIYF